MNSINNMSINFRASPRREEKGVVNFCSYNLKSRSCDHVFNISEHGIFFKCDKKLNIGSIIVLDSVELLEKGSNKDKNSFPRVGKVIRCEKANSNPDVYGVAIKFLEGICELCGKKINLVELSDPLEETYLCAECKQFLKRSSGQLSRLLKNMVMANI